VRTVRQWVHQTTGGLPRTFWFVWANMLVNRLGSFVLILLAFYLTQVRGLAPAYAGFVIGLWGAGGAIGTLIGGVLADRWGRKPTFLAAQFLSAALMLTLGFMRAPTAMAVTVFLLGLVSESARPVMSALMIDIVPEPDRLRAFSLNYWAINLGFSFAAVTAGFVANVDFMLLFVIDAATTVASALVILFGVPEPDRTGSPGAAVRPARRSPAPARRAAATAAPGLRQVFADRVFLAYVGVNLLTSLIFMQHLSTLPIAMGRDGLSASTFGSVIALNGVLIVAAQLFLTRLLRKADHSAALALAAAVMAVGFGLTAVAHTAWLYAVTVLIWTVGEMLNAPSNAAINADLAPADLRGRYQGVFSLSWSAASFAAPLAGAAVLQYLGNAALWLSCFVVLSGVAGLHLVSAPARRRRAAALHTAELAAPAPIARPARSVSPADIDVKPEPVTRPARPIGEPATDTEPLALAS
jgi:MFS family permease